MRIVASERYAVPSPEVIRTTWTLEDVADAWLVLDMYDRLERKAAQKAKANGSS